MRRGWSVGPCVASRTILARGLVPAGPAYALHQVVTLYQKSTEIYQEFLASNLSFSRSRSLCAASA